MSIYFKPSVALRLRTSTQGRDLKDTSIRSESSVLEALPQRANVGSDETCTTTVARPPQSITAIPTNAHDTLSLFIDLVSTLKESDGFSDGALEAMATELSAAAKSVPLLSVLSDYEVEEQKRALNEGRAEFRAPTLEEPSIDEIPSRVTHVNNEVTKAEGKTHEPLN